MQSIQPARESKLDWLCVRRLARLWPILFHGNAWSAPSLLASLLLVASLAEQLAIYQMGLIPSRFYSVLTSQPVAGFERLLVDALAVTAVVVVLKSITVFLGARLALLWRQLLSAHIHKRYFHDFCAYQINHVAEFSVENPDQRMVQDVDALTRTLASTLVDAIILPATIAYYTHALAQAMTLFAPLCIFAYFAIGLAGNRLLMGPVLTLTLSKDRAEGDLRFAHAHHRSVTEPAAMLGGSRVERALMDERLGTVTAVQERLLVRQLALDVWVNAFAYLSALLSYSLVAVPILAGVYAGSTAADLSALISKTSFLAMYLLGSFSTLINKAKDVSTIASHAHRVGELLESIDVVTQQRLVALKAPEPHDCVSQDDCICAARPPNAIVVDPTLLSFERVTFALPGHTSALLRDLTVVMRPGSNLLVSGPSGSGKTSLVRVLLGLWPCLSGTVTRPAIVGRDILFVPQQPCFLAGSLLACVQHPTVVASNVGAEAERARAALSALDLLSLVDRAGSVDAALPLDWFAVLSKGEQQRLALARVIFHRPDFCVLDEATTALGEAAEQRFYEACARDSITVLTIGQSLSLVKHHRQLLQLDGRGGWNLTRLDPSA